MILLPISAHAFCSFPSFVSPSGGLCQSSSSPPFTGRVPPTQHAPQSFGTVYSPYSCRELITESTCCVHPRFMVRILPPHRTCMEIYYTRLLLYHHFIQATYAISPGETDRPRAVAAPTRSDACQVYSVDSPETVLLRRLGSCLSSLAYPHPSNHLASCFQDACLTHHSIGVSPHLSPS
jgi:hypothetical protein